MKETYPPVFGTLKSGKQRNHLPPVILAAIKTIQTTKVCPKGFEFFLEGQSPLGIYILYSGRVELSVTDSHGRQMGLGTALPGNILGLSGVLSGKCHEETAVAAVPSQTGFVKSGDFLSLMDHHPEAAFWVVQLMSAQVTTTLEHLSCITHAPSGAVRQ